MVQIHPEAPLAAYAARELEHRYRSADAATVRRGRTWYAAARRECRRLAAAHGRTVAQVAAVMAITSPDAQLGTNLRWTAEILEGRRAAGKYPGDQAPKVRAALRSSRPGRYASGPKVSAFYRAIMGDRDVLVIDRWAAYAAGGTRNAAPGRPARRALEHAYRRAAAAAGESLRDFQAIVWIAARESTPRADGRAYQLADITA